LSGRPKENPELALGLILRGRPWGESDFLLDIFTDHQGRISALAKGGQRSKRRFVGLLLSAQLLNLGLKTYPKSNLRLLSQATLITSYAKLREDYQRWLAAGPILELLLRGTAYLAPMPEILYLAIISLKRIAQSQHHLEQYNALLLFINRFLQESGCGLHLGRCLLCGQDTASAPAALSLQGGLVCRRCRPHEPAISPGIINILRASQGIELNALPRLSFTQPQIKQLMPFMSAFARQALNQDFLSFDLVGAPALLHS
jgi:DNA repair protein RecO (recombination protein O)